MPIRFRRTYKIFPGVRINVSKSGISTTIGPRGFHLTFSKHGIRRTIGLPGTGISETSYVVDYKPNHEQDRDARRPENERERPRDEDEGNELGCFPWGCLTFVVVALVAVYFGARSLDLIPPDYLSQLMQQMAQNVHEAGY